MSGVSNSEKTGCGAYLILFMLLCLTWFLPEFIRHGGNVDNGLQGIGANLYLIFIFGVIAFIFYAIFYKS